jgi:predicted nucleotidyltransferase
MIDISAFMEQFLQRLDEAFGGRVWFVGLQGSYGRGEATDHSDIDVVLILDVLSAEDLRAYEAMLDTLPHRERICGFVSGKAELLSWEPSDLFQFYYDTKPIKGTLDELLSLLDSAAVDRAIRIGACNLYHGCVHNMLHEKSDEILKGLYKSASFVVQAIAFRQTGRYFSRQKDLLDVVSPAEQAIVNTVLHLKNGGAVDFDAMSQTLFAWAGQWIENVRDAR